MGHVLQPPSNINHLYKKKMQVNAGSDLQAALVLRDICLYRCLTIHQHTQDAAKRSVSNSLSRVIPSLRCLT